MFSLWSILNSSLIEEKLLVNTLEKYKPAFKETLSGYYKPPKSSSTTATDKDLKKNEKELIKKFSETLNLDVDLCADLYKDYLTSTYNQFQVTDQLFEKIATDELVKIHFEKFFDFYNRERYCFIKILIIICSVVGDNTIEEEESYSACSDTIRQTFTKENLETIYKSVLKDYTFLCKKIKVCSGTSFSANALITEEFSQKSLIQTVNELELTLELLLILVSVNKAPPKLFYEVAGEFAKQSILKWLSTSKHSHQINATLFMEQISYLQVLISVKVTRLDQEVLGIENDTKLTHEEKIEFMSTNTIELISDLIGSFGSNSAASPIMLAYSSLLYSFSISENVGKVLVKDTVALMNRLFSVAVKENVMNNLLMILASNLFSNQETLWCITKVIYDLVNSVLHLFDENSLGDNLCILFDICFFCMQKNKRISSHFWTSCKQPDRGNLTILMSHALETFPINLGFTFSLFSLIARTGSDFCKEVVDYLTHMDQFCEYFEDLNPNEYISNGDSVKLTRNRKLFDGYFLPSGHKGCIFASNSCSVQQQGSMAHALILQAPAVGWQYNYNCYDLIKTYFHKINFLAERNNLSGEQNVHSIIELIDSIFEYFFDVEPQMSEREFEMNTKYLEMFVNSSFTLFSSLMDKEWPDSYRLISKLLGFFNNISSQIYDKLIRVFQQNELIGYNIACEQMTIQQVLSNRHNLIKNSTKLRFIFQSGDKKLINNYVKLIDNLIIGNGNNIHYMNPLFCVLVYVFPDVFKWKRNSFDVDIDLSVSCLNLLHSILNTGLSNSSTFIQNTDTVFPQNNPKVSAYSIDTLCEAILINTECSESLLNLIHVGYECSNDQFYLNKIKKLDNILNQTISLVNRLIVVPTNPDDQSTATTSVSESALYLNLIKYINQQQTHLTDSSYDSQKALSDPTITKNNQFIMQLDVLMSSTSNSSSVNTEYDEKNNTNWFHLLTKIAIYKSNRTVDCLLFSLFKKISQLTPLLFGSLLGQYANKIHTVLLNKIDNASQGQIIPIVCEFLCSLIENQPAFFQKLADQRESNESDEKLKGKLVEGEKSILKALFKLLGKLKKNNPDYYVSIAGIYSVFYTIWSNKKLDYMNYCKSKTEFWPMLANTLHEIKKDVDLSKKQTNLEGIQLQEMDPIAEYHEFFDIEDLNLEGEFSRFDEFIVEANIKSVASSLKIYTIEIFELCFDKNNTNDMIKYFSENIFEKNLLEKWLGFYAFQLKHDLNSEARHIFNQIQYGQEQVVKADMSIMNINLYNKKNQNKNSTSPAMNETKKELKSKLLLDSITSLFLLINKITRITNIPSNNKAEMFLDKINMKRIKLNVVFNHLIDSILEMINHFLLLNNELLCFQQEQEQVLDYDEISKMKSKSTNDFITLKQSNEIVKQFHSIASTLMVTITSIKNIDDSSLLNFKQLIYDLITIMDRLMMEDFNYFPSVINAIQTSILHVFTGNTSSSQTAIDILKQDESILKKLLGSMFKVFTMSTVYLEKEKNMQSSSFHESLNIFVLNTRILNFLMNRISDEYWHTEMTERCVLQCLYSLFEKYIQNQNNSKICFSVLEMLFTFANKQVEFLVKSDFNSLTCLLIGKLFNQCYSKDNEKQSDEKVKTDSVTWSSVLCLYFDIQTVMLKSLKLLYLKDSIIFFGSYYETIARIIIDSRESFEADVLEIIRTFSRYLAQISKYKRELLINLPQSAEYLEQIFCDILHSCISKTRQIKSVSTRLNQQLHTNAQKKDQTTQQKAANLKSKKEIEKCISVQNLLFPIMSISLDGIANYMPNLGEFSYATHLDEYKLLLTTQLAQPSSFDTFSPFSFGSILWMIDYCLKISQKNEIGSSGISKQSITTTPKKNTDLNQPGEIVSPSKKGPTSTVDETAIETKLGTKQIITGILEKLLNFILTQTVLFERHAQYSARDKKIFKRELSSEINSILQGFNKSFKRTGSTIQYASKSPSKMSSGNLMGSGQTQSFNFLSFSSKHTCEFFKFIQTFLQQNTD